MKFNGCTLIKIILITLLFSILLISCHTNISFPANISIEGFPFERIKAKLISFEFHGSTLKLILEKNNDKLPVKISSFSRNLLKFKKNYNVEINKLYSPTGPSHYIRISHKKRLKYIIGDNQGHTHKILDKYSISPGQIIHETENKSRVWVNLIIKDKDRHLELKPGVLTPFIFNKKKCKILLFGPSLKIDSVVKKVNPVKILQKDKNINRQKQLPVSVSEPGQINNEEPYFIFDYIIFL